MSSNQYVCTTAGDWFIESESKRIDYVVKRDQIELQSQQESGWSTLEVIQKAEITYMKLNELILKLG